MSQLKWTAPFYKKPSQAQRQQSGSWMFSGAYCKDEVGGCAVIASVKRGLNRMYIKAGLQQASNTYQLISPLPPSPWLTMTSAFSSLY